MSVGNARFLHTLSQQLHVPREDARNVAEDVLDVELICALEGDYQLEQQNGGLPHWVSSAWEQGNAQGGMPATYRAPVLDWFRGLNVDLTMHEEKLYVHAELDMQRIPRASVINLPLFNLFGGKSSEENADKKSAAKPKADAKPKVELLPEPIPAPPPIDGKR